MAGNPHDALFKAVFGDPEHAASALRAALPAALAGAIDWMTLARVAGSFVDGELREQHTDLLFTARWAGGCSPRPRRCGSSRRGRGSARRTSWTT